VLAVANKKGCPLTGQPMQFKRRILHLTSFRSSAYSRLDLDRILLPYLLYYAKSLGLVAWPLKYSENNLCCPIIVVPGVKNYVRHQQIN